MSRFIAGAVAALAVGGCATAGQGASSGTAEQDKFEVVVRVENNQWNEMRVFVEGGLGAQQFLGTVPARGSALMRLPRHLAESDELRLIADPMGSVRQMISEPFRMESSGHNITWQLRKSGNTRILIM